jgi:hypothetical protein
MDYNEFSEKIKAKYPQYKDMDNKELAQKMVAKYPQYGDITFDDVEQPRQPKGIDLTPSGVGRTMATATVAPFYAAKTGQKVSDAYNEIQDKLAQKPKTGLEKTLDVAATFALPQAKILQAGKLAPLVNNLVTGAYQGGLIGGIQGLQEDKGLEGAAGGAGIGATLTAGLPLVGKVAKKGLELLPQTGGLFARTLGRIQPETLKRAVQPDSIALDLTRDEAQNLLMNTAEDIQKGYKNLLNKKSENIENAINNLKTNDAQVDAMGLMTDIENTFNQYGGSKINPARNMTGNLENNLYDLIAQGVDETGNLSAIDLQKAKEQIGKMVKWDDMTAQNYYNPILEQVYGKYNSRLNNLSPQLKQANKEYSELNDFMKNEGVRRILQKGDRDTIDTASSALRNYNSTVTKGNTNRNVQDLEKILVENGYEPFINKVDDVNAAMDLLNARTTGDSWLANLATQMTRPALQATRGLNRAVQRYQIPQKLENLKNLVGGWERYTTPGLYGAPAMMLQGGLQYNDYQ